MKKNTLQKIMLAAALLTLVSCTQDEPMEQSTALPDGVYPITFTAVQALPEETPDGTPQTRVSDYDEGSTHKSKWTAGDEIKVKVTTEDNAKVQESICTLDEHGTITNYNPQLYWQTTGKHTINAWYSNIDGQSTETEESKIVSLADQRQGLAYVLKAKEAEVSFWNRTNSTALSFTHQLAKVRVMLTGEKADGVESVQINNYTSCTVTNGDVLGKDPGYIQMRKNDDGDYYEANLVPMQSITPNNFIKLNGNTQVSVSNISQLDAETVYTIKITVNKKAPVEKNISDIPEGQNYNVAAGEHLILKGNSKDNNLRLTLGKGSTLELQNVTFSQNTNIYNPAIIVTDGATIIVSGTNKITGPNNNSSSGAIHVNKGTLIIKKEDGKNDDKCKLELIALENNDPYGAYGNGALTLMGKEAHLIIESGHIIADSRKKTDAAGIGSLANYGGPGDCGEIIIKGGIVEAKGGRLGPGIGSARGSRCGKITISGGTVTAEGGESAAGIGTGNGQSAFHGECGDITISGGTVTATGKNGAYDIGPGAYGDGRTPTCGTVFIYDKNNVTATNSKIWGQN